MLCHEKDATETSSCPKVLFGHCAHTVFGFVHSFSVGLLYQSWKREIPMSLLLTHAQMLFQLPATDVGCHFSVGLHKLMV